MTRARTVNRLGTGDLVELVSDVGPVPRHVGALLVLARSGSPGAPDARPDAAPDTEPGPGTVMAALRARASRIEPLARRLGPARPGRRPGWVEDTATDLDTHVTHETCAAPGDDETLLALATAIVHRPLPRSRPLWRAVVVSGLRDGGLAVVVAMHHVLADGTGGLALLARLVDAPGPAPNPPGPAAERRVRPPSAQGARDRTAPAGAPAAPRHRSLPRPAPACSLNAPTGTRRRIVPVDLDLDTVLAAARAHGGTVNDVLLTSVAGAMARTLDARGEHVRELVVSVLVAARGPGAAGNQVAVMPVRVPVTGPAGPRLAEVVRRTSALKARGRRGVAPGYTALVRLLAAGHLLGPFLDHQRLISSTLTTMRGPVDTLTLAGASVTRVVPLTGTTGNVGVSFAALSYAGRLTVTVVVDPDVVPEADALADAVRAQVRMILDAVPGAGAAGRAAP
jgi:WS/DGAT/MGAT family acyltransferase